MKKQQKLKIKDLKDKIGLKNTLPWIKEEICAKLTQYWVDNMSDLV